MPRSRGGWFFFSKAGRFPGDSGPHFSLSCQRKVAAGAVEKKTPGAKPCAFRARFGQDGGHANRSALNRWPRRPCAGHWRSKCPGAAQTVEWADGVRNWIWSAPVSAPSASLGAAGAFEENANGCTAAGRWPGGFPTLAMAPLQGFPRGKLARKARLMRERTTQICR